MTARPFRNSLLSVNRRPAKPTNGPTSRTGSRSPSRSARSPQGAPQRVDGTGASVQMDTRRPTRQWNQAGAGGVPLPGVEPSQRSQNRPVSNVKTSRSATLLPLLAAALGLTACSSGCPGGTPRCPAPPPVPVAFRVSVNGRPVSNVARVELAAGRPIRLHVRMTIPDGSLVTALSLGIGGTGGWGAGTGGQGLSPLLLQVTQPLASGTHDFTMQWVVPRSAGPASLSPSTTRPRARATTRAGARSPARSPSSRSRHRPHSQVVLPVSSCGLWKLLPVRVVPYL